MVHGLKPLRAQDLLEITLASCGLEVLPLYMARKSEIRETSKVLEHDLKELKLQSYTLNWFDIVKTYIKFIICLIT